MGPLDICCFRAFGNGCLAKVRLFPLDRHVVACGPKTSGVSFKSRRNGIFRVIEDVDVMGDAWRTKKVVERKSASDVCLATLYPQTGKPLEYFGLKSRGSHFRILPIRLNASRSPWLSMEERTCSS